MSFDQNLHHRHSLRLKGYDYHLHGAYYVTVCTHERQCLMGQVMLGSMQLNAVGQVVLDAWAALPARFPDVQLDAFVVMPNHVHGILCIDHDVGAVLAPPAPGAASGAPTLPAAGAASGASTLGEIMRAFKSLSAIAANRILGRSGVPFWQRNYYEHIVRNDHDLDEIREYIVGNPVNWEKDENNLQPRP